MKNKDFFYLQYDKVCWKNQEKTKINFFINDYIIREIILKHKGNNISIFDIGFGIGYFFRMLLSKIKGKYKNIVIEGCEPSQVNYNYFLKKRPKKLPAGVVINTFKSTFQDFQTDNKFDFVTAIYVFSVFLLEDLDDVVRKIYSMLKNEGKFILVLAEEKYLENKLKIKKDLFIEKRNITYKGKKFKEFLHYSDIPKIGKIIDCNREEAFYIYLFQNNNFKLSKKENLEHNGFVFTLYVFEKNNKN